MTSSSKYVQEHGEWKLGGLWATQGDALLPTDAAAAQVRPGR